LVESFVLGVTKWNIRNANHVVTVTDSLHEWLKTIGIKNSSLIPNGVELDRFKPENQSVARAKLGRKEIDGKFVISYTGSVECWYDLDVVARATALVNAKGVPSIFQVVGGHLVNQQNNLFAGFENNVFQVGLVDYNQVSRYINASDVCVLPLKNMAKNLARPLKLFEYFSCGKPVLSLPNSQVEREFGDAITIFHDEAELAEIMLATARGEMDYSAKIRKGLEYAKDNSWDIFADSYEQLLLRIIAQYPHVLASTILTDSHAGKVKSA
jgi:glycosyltransferase involved in cell wall biosynthesis